MRTVAILAERRQAMPVSPHGSTLKRRARPAPPYSSRLPTRARNRRPHPQDRESWQDTQPATACPLRPSYGAVFDSHAVFSSYGGPYYPPPSANTQDASVFPVALLFGPEPGDELDRFCPSDTGALFGSGLWSELAQVVVFSFGCESLSSQCGSAPQNCRVRSIS